MNLNWRSGARKTPKYCCSTWLEKRSHGSTRISLFLAICVYPWNPWLEFWSSDIAEDRLLPAVRWKIPVTRARLVIITAAFVSNRRIFPVIHAHLQQRTRRDFDPRSYRATFALSQGQSRAGRRTPEVPDFVRALPYSQDDSVVGLVVSEWHWLMSICAEPRVPAIKAATHFAGVVVQNHFMAIDSAA